MNKFALRISIFMMIFLLACGDDSSSITEPLDESSSSVVKSSSSSKTKKSSSSSSAKSSSGKKTSSSSKKAEQSSSSTNRSSSSVASSSSVNRSSSSVASSASRSSSSSESLTVDPSTVVVDSIIDSRDGKTYKTVKIGTQTWMAENLNFYTPRSYCYDGDGSNCVKYGRLYAWSVAMDSAGTWSASGKGCGYGLTCSPTGTVRGICPSGYHLPDTTEWRILFNAVGGNLVAGAMLRSLGYSFSLEYSSGGRDGYGKYFEFFGDVWFWTSTGAGNYFAFSTHTEFRISGMGLLRNQKEYAYSVRCIKDESSNDSPSSSSTIAKSSDSVAPPLSSSSVIRSSSSISKITVDTSTVVIDSITDARDGQTYRTVTIGSQTWMAQNLNYEVADSYCYYKDSDKCKKYGYGRLYYWSAAMDSAGKWSTNGKGCGFGLKCFPTEPVRGVCPAGWHLPTSAEFYTLYYAAGGINSGLALRASTSWDVGSVGRDKYSFSALAAGMRNNYDGMNKCEYSDEGKAAFFWSSSELDPDQAFYMRLYGSKNKLDITYIYRKKGDAMSVRCVKD